MLLFKRKIILVFTVSLSIFFDKLPNVVVDRPCDPLDYMKRIDHRNRIWKILFNV